jgi:hypothetical protein
MSGNLAFGWSGDQVGSRGHVVTWSNGQVSGCLVYGKLDCDAVRKSSDQAVRSQVIW